MFWRNITNGVDEPIKVGDTEDDIFNILLQLDLTNFVELRYTLDFQIFTTNKKDELAIQC